MSAEVVLGDSWQRTHRPGFTLTTGQALLVALVLGLGLPLLLSTVEIALPKTVLIFLFVLVAGLALCHLTRRKLNDPRLHLLGTFWLIKLGVTLLLLYVGWIPQLDPGASDSWGYDPQRFYYDAQDLIENGWTPVAGSTYQGIIFYYGTIFYLFGHNPVIPALINAFVTLLGTLYLIRLAYEFKGARGPQDWKLAYLLLIPEILWYDVMTSRETLAAVLVLVSSLAAGRYLLRSGTVSLPRTLLLVGGCLGSILAVRTSMAVPVIGSIGLMALFLQAKKGFGLPTKLLIVALGIGLLAAGPWVQQIVGGGAIDYLAIIQSAQSFDGNVAAQTDMVWSENSIGLLLSPSNAWQAIVFTLPRMVLYLAAPLPNIVVSPADLMAGSWPAWQRLMTIPTSVLNLLVLPYAMAGFSHAWRQRRLLPAPLVLHFTFWMTFIAIATGNIIIHERYRLMMTLLLFASAWLGYTSCTRRQIARFAYLWFALLATGAVFFLGYKAL